MNILIEDFIKHLESKGYISNSKSKYKAKMKGNSRYYWFQDNNLVIENNTQNLFRGKIESLEQFDLIDRLTS